MQVFHIKGLPGLLVFLVVVIAALLVAIALPSSFLMVLWNATVFEGMHGPQINILQGLLLWMMALITLKLIFKPTIQLQFKALPSQNELKSVTSGLADKQPEPAKVESNSQSK